MVKETRIMFEPCDIRALCIVCRTCGAETRIRLGTKDKMSIHCPHCDTMWKKHNSTSTAEELRNLLVNLQNPPEPESFTVRMEVNGEGSADSTN